MILHDLLNAALPMTDTPEAHPEVTGIWGLFGVLATALAPAVTGYVAFRYSRPRAEPITPEREHIERESGLSTAGMSEENVRMFYQLFQEISQLRHREDRLEARIKDLKRGVEAGEYPPWPDDDFTDSTSPHPPYRPMTPPPRWTT